MQPTPSQIGQNLVNVRNRIEAAALRVGRSPGDVRMVAVTKTVGIEAIRTLADLGVCDFGENRVDLARPKVEALDRTVWWHMIGSIQRRKARDVVELFDCVHSIDRVEVGETLSRLARDHGRRLEAYMELNVSGETSKHGFDVSDIARSLPALRALDGLQIVGLMTMAPFVEDPETARPVFRELKRLADVFGLPRLSMGMSNDFEVAIEEGSTCVRIGTALFE